MNKFLNEIGKKRKKLSLLKKFDIQVFDKIKRKKLEKKIEFTIVALLIVFISMILILPDKNIKQEPIIAKEKIKKIDVPVLDEIYFGTSDEKNTYSIEFVSLDDEDDGI